MVEPPIWNILVKLDHFPRDRGENSKNIWNQHLENDSTFTLHPLKINMEPENAPWEKETHLQTTNFWGSMLIFGGVVQPLKRGLELLYHVGVTRVPPNPPPVAVPLVGNQNAHMVSHMKVCRIPGSEEGSKRCFPTWMVNGDPYNGLLQSLYNGVV